MEKENHKLIKSEENKISELNKSIEGLSITEQLDYLLKSNMGFKFCVPVTTLGIPEKIYNTHFINGLNNPEFTYWFLKYNANEYFEYYVNSEEFQNKILSGIRTHLIQDDLNELELQEQNAISINKKEKLNFFHPYRFNRKFHREVELLRILDGNYYEKNVTEAIGYNDSATYTYFKHILLKRHLKSLLEDGNEKKIEPKDLDNDNKKAMTFGEMFEYPKLIQDCIDVLKQVKPPIITDNNTFNLGNRSKGSIVAWITALKSKGLIKNNLSDTVVANLLNSKFKNFNLGTDGRTLRNFQTTSYNKYYTTILNLLPELPLSTKGKSR